MLKIRKLTDGKEDMPYEARGRQRASTIGARQEYAILKH